MERRDFLKFLGLGPFTILAFKKSVAAEIQGEEVLKIGKVCEIPISNLVIDEKYNIRASDLRMATLDDVRALADSIKEIGLVNPITVTTDCRVITGFRRIKACKLLGKNTITCIAMPAEYMTCIRLNLVSNRCPLECGPDGKIRQRELDL